MLLSGSKHKALATKLASTRYSAHFVMRLRPNPALKRSAKSGLQGPVCGVAAFFPQPGPRNPLLAPA